MLHDQIDEMPEPNHVHDLHEAGGGNHSAAPVVRALTARSFYACFS
jgi:hypothetical protein